MGGPRRGHPDWLHDYNANLIRACHGNYMRWMHISPQKVDADAMARYGIIQVCPAGDKEREVTGRQWEQRLEVMRASIIYFRNNPSILFWEAGNTIVTPEEMEQMVALRKQWDPYGGRVMGYRDNDDLAANAALTPIAEYYGVMIGQDAKTDALTGPNDMFRGYSAYRRDRAPLVEAEDFREEGARRFWDDDSPPYYKAKKGPNDTWRIRSRYLFTSESFALAGIERYWAYWQNRISNPDPAHSKWSGYASIYFSDSDADGRQDSSEVCRVSGKVDAVRLPKEIYFAHRVMQNDQPDLHILGIGVIRWSSPPVRRNPPCRVGLRRRAVLRCLTCRHPGPTRAEDSKDRLRCCEHRLRGAVPQRQVAGRELEAGERLRLRVLPMSFVPGNPEGSGQERGQSGSRAGVDHGRPARSDQTYFDGRPARPPGRRAGRRIHRCRGGGCEGPLRCPTDDARVDFTISGPGIWRGGYNSGKIDSTNNLYLNTECGINRVFVRSTLHAGTIAITASRPGLKPAKIQIVAKPVNLAWMVCRAWFHNF
jgi:beta-galactosidase